jgi:hypothetical protein
MDRTCPVCHKQFRVRNIQTQCCSAVCYDRGITATRKKRIDSLSTKELKLSVTAKELSNRNQ